MKRPTRTRAIEQGRKAVNVRKIDPEAGRIAGAERVEHDEATKRAALESAKKWNPVAEIPKGKWWSRKPL